jgi:hypothetical protein
MSLLGHPFIQKGNNKNHVVQDLVKECLPKLLKARENKKTPKDPKDKKDDDSDEEEKVGTFQRGTKITFNRNTKTWSSDSSASYGTTVLNPDSASEYGTVEYKDGTVEMNEE